MADYHYLIVGGGMTADSAVRGIRALDAEGSIGLISRESAPPYDRPPLTKGLWQGKNEEDIWRGTEELGVEMHLGRTAVHLDPEDRTVTDDLDETYHYEKLLLATGGSPRKLPFGEGQVMYYRTYQDFKRLQNLAGEKGDFVIIGGGFIGAEIAAALAMQDRHVSMVFPESTLGANRLPKQLGEFLNDYYESQGVTLHAGHAVVGLEAKGDRSLVTTDEGNKIEADAVVAGLGIMPNTVLAEVAGLEVDDGILVNPRLETSHPDIFAAGDVAAFHNPALGLRMRVEHEDNANKMGDLAGRSMAGEDVEYDYLPYFYSDLFEYGYEAVGLFHNDMDIVEDWVKPNEQGVVYFLRDDRLYGVLLWNTWGKLEAARDLISAAGPYQPDDLLGQIR
jgi:3-phenylpropionate/trans-cinnamate dioxygenase ferredoxin reductase subunit